ncbi:MAG: hypothetical protein MUP99_00775 [Pedobacter sp.]|nr:hypothetical protein [Pedobacter sp.]
MPINILLKVVKTDSLDNSKGRIYSGCDNKSNMISFAAQMKRLQHALESLNNTKNVNGKE